MAVHAAARPEGPVTTRFEEGVSRGMAGMTFFVCSEIMLFGALFAGFFFVHSQAAAWPPNGVEKFLKVEPYNIILTIILIGSGLVAHWGLIGIKSGNRNQFKLGIGIAILLGSIFIGMQIVEWLRFIYNDHFTVHSSVYGATFFILTGFHGAHVIAGLCMLFVVIARAFWNDFTPTRHLFADASVLYWHFVDLVWVFVYLLLYALASKG